ncbi:acetate--CoA ligase family protein [Kribbella solani]|uniref:acetate--CoA ligase family protein n=1 Tax=Kribbella solani TaxID=236067 RepID=UPI0029AD89BA|nr:acetate--CoA ligase family protein [Kribbella solani]MDX2972662.1 acetate--CoA ligase family protein [Kribbella solani]
MSDPNHRLDRLLSPSSIAVVGASDKPGRIGTMVYENVIRAFAGPVYPVNPRGTMLAGRPAATSIDALPYGVDLAIVIVPAEQVVGAIEQCAANGVGGVTLLSSGFSEIGPEGAALQAELREVVDRTGIPVIGPNCIGFMNLHGGVMANFALPHTTELPVPGPVALVSQSGGFGSYITTKSLLTGVKLGWFVSTGNEVDVNIAEVLASLVERDEVKVLLVFSETLRDPDVFIGAARRAAELDKPIVLLKAGRSEEAARAAMSHTASIVGSAAVLDAVCRQYGVIVVDTMEEMLDLGLIFQDGRRARGSRIGIMTSSGGAGVLLADCAAAEGLTVPPIPERERAAIEAMMPRPFYGSVENPVDTTAQLTANATTYQQVLNALVAVDELDVFTTVTWAQPGPSNDAILSTYRNSAKPLAVLSTGYLAEFHEAGVPTYLDPRRAVHALSAVTKFSRRPALDPAPEATPAADLTAARALVARAEGRGLLLESDSKELLARYGGAITRERTVADAEEAVRAAREIGGAVALKAMSYQLPHKSDVGAIRLNLRTADEVRDAYDSMLLEVAERAPHAKVESVLVQQMVPARLELTCGLQRDPVFGAVVAVGLGGTTIEIMAAAELLHVPFGHAVAERTIRGMLGGRLVNAARGLDDAEVDQLADLMVSLGRLAVDLPEVVEVDVNPVRVSDGQAVAADALVVLAAVDPE